MPQMVPHLMPQIPDATPHATSRATSTDCGTTNDKRCHNNPICMLDCLLSQFRIERLKHVTRVEEYEVSAIGSSIFTRGVSYACCWRCNAA